MEALACATPKASRQPQEPATIRATLYDLIASINEAAGPDEEHVVTATVMHVLNTYRVTYTQLPLQGHRIVCDGQARPVASHWQRHNFSSQNEREKGGQPQVKQIPYRPDRCVAEEWAG
jgi:hypothetical protein